MSVVVNLILHLGQRAWPAHADDESGLPERLSDELEVVILGVDFPANPEHGGQQTRHAHAYSGRGDLGRRQRRSSGGSGWRGGLGSRK